MMDSSSQTGRAVSLLAGCWGEWKVAELTPENHHCPLLGSTCPQCRLLLPACLFQHVNPLLARKKGPGNIGGGTVFVYSGSGVNPFMNSPAWHAAERPESKPVYERVCDTVRGQVMFD